MSIPQVNQYLHAVLIQRGLTCDFVDPRSNAAARTAERLQKKLEARWGQARRD